MNRSKRRLAANQSVPTVLAFRSSYCETNNRAYERLFAFAHGVGWNLQVLDYGRATGNASELPRIDEYRIDVPRLLDFWKPDGCIVESSYGPWKLNPSDFARLPTVFFEWHPESLPKDTPCVCDNAAEIAEAAARELLGLGFADYAFVPCHDYSFDDVRKQLPEFVWSRERREAFRRFVEMNARRFHVFRESRAVRDMSARKRELEDWLVRLPKPCGIFAANDNVAVSVLAACRSSGIAVPDQVAVVGVDDVPAICESSVPSCSSVRRNNELAAELAGRLLQDLMADKGHVELLRTYGVLRLTRRESSRRVRGMDKRVAHALEFIRLHACDGIGPSEVFAEMGCSRSLANLRFRHDTGHSILDEIHAVRLERVKELLSRRDIVLSALPDFCGYASLSDLRRVFRQRVGCTIRAYRLQHAIQGAIGVFV